MRLKRKTVLHEGLYKERYDRVFIYRDGTWSISTSGTVDPESIRRIDRSVYHDLTHKQIDELLFEIEKNLS
jgi:hypothetical protein